MRILQSKGRKIKDKLPINRLTRKMVSITKEAIIYKPWKHKELTLE